MEREQALIVAQQPEHALHQAGLAYLADLVGQPVVWVPPGPFSMGSEPRRDPDAEDAELPQHELALAGYWIGRYPVKFAQIRAYVAATGYQPREWRSLRAEDDHPAVDINWHDALAYCRWLSDKTGLPVRLPSEAEWEKAARGTDGRVYPWGDEPPDEIRCNYGDNLEDTTPVGRYSPQGDSPYGCADMAGGVWEWTRSLWGEDPSKPDFKYPYHPEDGRENLEAADEICRVLRGGAFIVEQGHIRCAYRFGFNPRNRFGSIGFRFLVVSGSLQNESGR